MNELKEKTPKGYKQTEAGVIPEDWEVKKLEDIFNKITRGHVLSTKKISEKKLKPYVYPVYSSQTHKNGLLGYYNDYLFENAITWTTDGANAGDVKYRKGKFYCTNVCGVLLSNKGFSNICMAGIFGRISKKYVSYVGNPKLMNNVVKEIKVGIPKDTKEQAAIANVLSDTDTLIEKLEKLIAKKKAIKQGAMQELLTGKKRLPGFSGEWETKKIRDISQFLSGEISVGGDFNYLEIGDIKIDTKNYNVSSKEKKSVSGSVKIPQGTLLISTVRPTRGAITITKENLCASSAFCRLKIKNMFIFYIASSDKFLYYLGEKSSGGTYPTCSNEDILNYEFLLPETTKEQTAIAKILSNMDKEIESLEKKLKKYKKIKVGMMQQLLTGKIRIYEPAKQ